MNGQLPQEMKVIYFFKKVGYIKHFIYLVSITLELFITYKV